MMSSPSEMARFMRMMLNRGELDGVRIVDADTITRMETPTESVGARAGLKIGFGIATWVDPSRRIVTYGFPGGLEDFLSRYVYLPDQGVGYFFSINTSSPGSAYAEIDKVLFDFATRGWPDQKQETGGPVPNDISRWVGFYEPEPPSRLYFWAPLVGGISVYLDDARLFRRPVLGGPEQLMAVAPNLFRGQNDPIATTAFAIGPDDGRPVMVATLPMVSVPSYYDRTGELWPTIRLVGLALALLAMATSILFAMVWIPRKLLGQMQGVRHLTVRAVPLLGVLTFVGILFVARGTFLNFVRPTMRSLTLFILSLAFAGLSVWGLVLAIASLRFEMNRATRIHSLLVALSCFALAWYFASWGLLPLLTWRL
jgi:hypothetical protein